MHRYEVGRIFLNVLTVEKNSLLRPGKLIF
jgi:hypothetical protein